MAAMFILDPAAILAIAALITASSTLVWAVRRKPVTIQPRRFPAPWSIGGNDTCYWVEDAEGKRIDYVYFVERATMNAGDVMKLTRDEARRIARGARLPELLKTKSKTPG
jgi:hypothetical protein